MDIVVKGRNVEVPVHYREYVSEKLEKAVRYDQKIIRVDVELLHERNPRQADHCQRVEITCFSRGPVVRAEAMARDFYSALDEAIAKLDRRLRRAADRRRVHKRGRSPISVAEATADLPVDLPDNAGTRAPTAATEPTGVPVTAAASVAAEAPVTGRASSAAGTPAAGAAETGPAGESLPTDEADDYRPGRIVREKEHSGTPITVDDALFQMELLGHDFYLFQDKESGRPSVVYRRKAYDYGVISLTRPAGT